jgi:hypothetical protein
MHALCGGEIKREKGISGVDFPAVKSVHLGVVKPKRPESTGDSGSSLTTPSGGALFFLDCPFGWFSALGFNFLKRGV